MSIIYPPYIEGKIATQYGDELRIPFQLNRALGLNEVKYVRARIKSIVNNSVIGQILTTTDFKTQISNNIYEAKFSLMVGAAQQQINMLQSTSNGVKWQYYKIQLSFSNDNEASSAVDVWSTIGVFKYSIKPNVSIADLDEKQTSYNVINYIGKYSCSDTSEKVYRYKFDLYYEGRLEETSQWQLHNATKDEAADRSTDSYTISLDLENDKYYQLFYTVETNNGLIISSPGYYIKKQIYYEEEYDFGFQAISNSENGTVELKLIQTKEQNSISGYFKIMRKELSSNTWEEINNLVLDTQFDEHGELFLDSDYTVKQGVGYEYIIMRYSGNLYQKPLTTEPKITICNFEDAFLYDGNKQLRIRFNPKVSSFKNTILESKLDTIGGVYPFVFRNGRTKYKEFPISGLVSLLMDETGDFLNNKKDKVCSSRSETNSQEINNFNIVTNLTSDNIKNEREFKIKVLDWLTNGEPKLFRSPTEGNYIVRLINTSLSPNDALGRMLHTFSSTAYEIAALSYSNLVAYGFTKKNVDNTNKTYPKEINLDDYQIKTTISLHNAIKIKITDSTPGAQFGFTYASGYNTNIIIGNAGNYTLDTDDSDPIVAFEFDPIYRGKVKIELENQQDYRYTNSQQDNNGNKWYLESIKEIERVRQITNGLQNKNEDDLQDEDKDILLGWEKELSNNANEYIVATLKNIKYIKIRSKDLVFEGPDLPTCINVEEENWKEKYNFNYKINNQEGNFIPNDIIITLDAEGLIRQRIFNSSQEISREEGAIEIQSIGNGLIADIYYTEEQKVYKILTE